MSDGSTGLQARSSHEVSNRSSNNNRPKSSALSHRQGPTLLPQGSVALLEMQRHRVNQVGPNLALGQVLAQRITPGVTERELMKDRTPVRGLVRQPNVGQLNATEIKARDLLPASGPGREVRQLNVQQRALKSIHPEITAHDIVVVTPVRTMHANVARPRVEILAPRDQRPTLAALNATRPGTTRQRPRTKKGRAPGPAF